MTTQEIADYGNYLKSQGWSDGDVHGYTKHLSDAHEVDHPSESNKSWLDTEIPGGTPRGYIQGTLNALPTVGMVGGGLAAGAAGFAAPVPGGAAMGATVGAGLGGAGGEALKNLGEKYILGQDKTRSEIYGGPAKAGLDSATAEMGGQSLGPVLDAAAATKPVKYVSEKAGDFGKWLANNASNVPKTDIETYLKDPAKVMSVFKEAGGDEQELADVARKNINEKIQATKKGLNDQISQTLSQRSGQSVEAKPIKEALESAKTKINAKLNPEEIEEVNGLIKKADAVSDKNGSIPLQDAHDLKEYLRGQAKGSFAKNGQIFSVGDKTAKAAKQGAAVTRSLVDQAAPEVAQANSKLADLHDIDEVMGRNVLAEGKPANSLLSAASGENPSNAKALKGLAQATGTDIVGDAKLASAARTFGSPSLTPLDKTGKSVARMGAAGILGGTAGYLAGGDEKSAVIGGLAAEGLTSPAMIKLAIDSGVGAKALAKTAANAAPSAIGKGPVAWINSGFQKLLDHSEDDDKKHLQDSKDILLQSEAGKKLLIQASDLKPGSKAMANVLAKAKAKISEDQK